MLILYPDLNILLDMSIEFNEFIHAIETQAHFDYAGLDITSMVFDFFDKIGRNPDFLSSYDKYKEMPIYVPEFIKLDNIQIFTNIMLLLQNYSLLRATVNYITGFDVDNDNFKEYVFIAHMDIGSLCYTESSIPNTFENYSNTSYNLDKNPIIIPLMSDIHKLSRKIINLIKKFVHINKPIVGVDTGLYLNKPQFSYDHLIPNNYLLSRSINNILVYPHMIDTNWMNSFKSSPDIMHTHILNLKNKLVYDDEFELQSLSFYTYVVQYGISHTQQRLILLTHDLYPDDRITTNRYGELFGLSSKDDRKWVYANTFELKFDHPQSIYLDTCIIKKQKINWSTLCTDFLWKEYQIQERMHKWTIDRLELVDFSVRNIHQIITSIMSELKFVYPINIEESFCVLQLTGMEQRQILKEFMKNHNVWIDEHNALSRHVPIMVIENEPLPVRTRVIFDMPYCILCMQTNYTFVIKSGFNSISKIYRSRYSVTQPYFCNDCFELMCKIIPHHITLDSIQLKINSDIIDLYKIKEKFSLIILANKSDLSSGLGQIIPDIIHYIIRMYIWSIGLVQRINKSK